MSAVEAECLDSLRRAMKLHCRWLWDNEAEFESVYAAMSYLECRLTMDRSR